MTAVVASRADAAAARATVRARRDDDAQHKCLVLVHIGRRKLGELAAWRDSLSGTRRALLICAPMTSSPPPALLFAHNTSIVSRRKRPHEAARITPATGRPLFASSSSKYSSQLAIYYTAARQLTRASQQLFPKFLFYHTVSRTMRAQ